MRKRFSRSAWDVTVEACGGLWEVEGMESERIASRSADEGDEEDMLGAMGVMVENGLW